MDSQTLERIHSMLKMFANTECTIHELEKFLSRKIREGKLMCAGGVYKLVTWMNLVFWSIVNPIRLFSVIQNCTFNIPWYWTRALRTWQLKTLPLCRCRLIRSFNYDFNFVLLSMLISCTVSPVVICWLLLTGWCAFPFIMNRLTRSCVLKDTLSELPMRSAQSFMVDRRTEGSYIAGANNNL